MNKAILKKATLLSFALIALFLAIISSSTTRVLGYDFSESNSWDGSDLSVSPLGTVNYESDYVPFSEITDDVNLVDPNKVYVIETATDLFNLSEVSRGVDQLTYNDLDYVLGRDIDYYEAVLENAGARFIPIGYENPFTGTFDGQGYEITNLFLKPISSEFEYETEYPSLRYYSMFSVVGTTGVVKNLGLINPIMIQPIEFGFMQYASALVGENNGLVENVYLIDDREDAAGLSAEGYFHISGLVSVNKGIFKDSFVSSPQVRSRAVFINLSADPVLFENDGGTLERIYYDQDVYTDPVTPSTLGTGLDTVDFQNDANFSSDWFFNDTYLALASTPEEETQILLDDTYPTLQGLGMSGTHFTIENAVELNYMNELIAYSGFYRSAEYVITSDIDMNRISSFGYRPASVAFRGMLRSALSTPQTRRYVRDPNHGGATDYHSIIDLRIKEGAESGNFVSYGLFNSLFGTVRDLNIVNAEIKPDDLDRYAQKDRILIGTIAGLMNLSTIENVHVMTDIEIASMNDAPGEFLVANLVADGGGAITESTTTGTITHGVHPVDSRSDQSASAGFVARARELSIEESRNDTSIIGIGFDTVHTNQTYLGGLVGYGRIIKFNRIINQGALISHQSQGYLDNIHMGGIIGYQESLAEDVRHVYNNGTLELKVTQELDGAIAGYGSVSGQTSGEDDNFDFYSITNNGSLQTTNPNAQTFTNTELSNINVDVAGVLIQSDLDANHQGLFNDANMTFDLSFIRSSAAVLNVLSTNDSSILQAYNTGDFVYVSSLPLTKTDVKISNNMLGANLDIEHVRNEGDLDVEMNHPTTVSGNLYVLGLFEEVSQNRKALNGFNGGDLTVSKDSGVTNSYDIYLSGIAYKNANTDFFQQNSISSQSIDFDPLEGPMDHVLNDGNLLIEGNFSGSTRATGIVTINASILTNAINLGDIENYNDVQTANDEVDSAGIAYLMLGEYAQIRDAANYGSIKAASSTTLGYAHASGIAIRNEREEDGSVTPTTNNAHFAKIVFTMNYGDIYAWNGTDETSYQISDETRSKAAGILTMGVLSVINNINYGNIYSRYLSGGIFGFVYLNRFRSIDSGEVYISNDINYGKPRAITAYNQSTNDFTVNLSDVPTRTAYNAFGAMIGKIHNGLENWQFANWIGTVEYPIDDVYFGYLLNFDEKANMIDNAPYASVQGFSGLFGTGNEQILDMLQYMGTANPNDDSAPPFTEFERAPIFFTWTFGKVIDYYSVDESVDGFFYSEFPFREARPSIVGTDRYIKDYFQYIEEFQVNPEIITRLEADGVHDYPGIYALSSSKKIGNGIFIPDHFDIGRLHPYAMGSSEPDTTWIGDDTTVGSISYKLYVKMRQIRAGFATSVYDLEIQQVDGAGNPVPGGLTLSGPTIDQTRGLITYYLPSNAEILAGSTSELVTAYSFVEAGEGTGTKVPDIPDAGPQTYKWVGDYKKVGNDFVEIGPYHPDGNYDVTFTSDQSWTFFGERYERVAMDGDSVIPFVHNNYIRGWFVSGYAYQSRSAVASGYGPYRFVTRQEYEYVGPNPEPVTYIRTDVTEDVTVYDPVNVQFQANLDPDTYTIAESASFEYLGSSDQDSASIPRSYGIYDSLNEEDGTFIDSVEQHYGRIRVFSEAYVPGDQNTFRDYDIRIIRTDDAEITDIETLDVNGVNALPGTFDVADVTATQDLFYTYDGINGKLEVTYETDNFADGYEMLPYATVFDDNDDPVDEELYVLLGGVVSTDEGFNNQFGTWGTGRFEFELRVTDLLPSGDYYLEIRLVTGDTHILNFTKIASSNKDVLSFTFDGEMIEPVGSSEAQTIPYGIFYESGREETDIVNFTNLSSLSDIYYTDLTGANIPSYLTDIVISPFATLDSITLSITSSGGLYTYQIDYLIRAEDNTTKTFTHTLTEEPLEAQINFLYRDGGTLDLPLTEVIIGYEDAPTLRVEYDFSNTYFPDDSVLSTTSSFTPLNTGESASEGTDYFIIMLSELGFEVDFQQNIAMGEYLFMTSYQSSVSLWGENLAWSFDLDDLIVRKVENDNSKLKDIFFVSDTVFAGFDTIIDNQFMDVSDYIDYLENPETRKIITLPSEGIVYNQYDDSDTYYIVGQVQRTTLTVYQPTFTLPFGAEIYRVIDENNVGPEFQSETLTADFSPNEDESLNYVQYRVYAQDYDENPDHYTDFYVAVQDVTNNVRFLITVENDTTEAFNRVYLSMQNCIKDVGYTGSCTYEELEKVMSMFSYYDQTDDEYANSQFQTVTYGTYRVLMDLPTGFGFEIEINDQPVTGDTFYIEDTIIPRRYRLNVTIKETTDTDDWGKREIFKYLPNTVFYQFNQLNPNSFVKIGTWTVESEGFSTTYGNLFIDHGATEYTVEATAQLGIGSYSGGLSGGYGIHFDTVLDGIDDSGFIFQFDRGFTGVNIRERIDGGEQPVSAYARNADNPIIPTSKSDPWWTDDHVIRLEIEVIDETTRSLDAYIDDSLVIADYEYQTYVGPTDQNHVGFRVWQSQATFIDLRITGSQVYNPE